MSVPSTTFVNVNPGDTVVFECWIKAAFMEKAKFKPIFVTSARAEGVSDTFEASTDGWTFVRLKKTFTKAERVSVQVRNLDTSQSIYFTSASFRVNTITAHMQPKNGVALVDDDAMKAPPGLEDVVLTIGNARTVLTYVTQIDEDAKKVGHKNVHALTGDEVYFYLWARAAGGGSRKLKLELREPGSAGQVVSETFTLTSDCLLYTSPSPRDYAASRMPSSA